MGFNRYYATTKKEYNGIVFDSGAEVKRYRILVEAQKRGLISDLRLQVVFTLIPRQTEPVEVKLKTKTKIVERFREHPVTYAADFVYIKDGKEVIEDQKSPGVPLPDDYIIKRKLMLFQGRQIKEVYDYTDDFPEIAQYLQIDPPKQKKKKPKKALKPKDHFDNPGLFE